MTDSGAARQTGRDLPRLGRNLLVAAIPLAIGAFFGYLTAYQASLPDLAGLASVLYFVLAALIIGLAALVGLVALVWPGGRGRSAGLLTLATAGLLGLGYLGGVVLTPVLGLDYRAPVTLQARGTATLRLEGQPSFTTEESASASCTSGRDSVEVQEVWAALGAVGRGTVLGRVTRTGSDLVSVTLEYREAGVADRGPEWTARDQTADLENGERAGMWPSRTRCSSSTRRRRRTGHRRSPGTSPGPASRGVRQAPRTPSRPSPLTRRSSWRSAVSTGCRAPETGAASSPLMRL